MSYKAATIQQLAAGETGYQLTSDPGADAYVAARWECTRDANNLLHLRWHMRQVNADGSPVHDAAGNAVAGVAYECITLPEINANGGIETVKAQLLATALGEPDALRDVPDDIRDAIQAAALVT